MSRIQRPGRRNENPTLNMSRTGDVDIHPRAASTRSGSVLKLARRSDAATGRHASAFECTDGSLTKRRPAE
jgi:hypothetical protein